MPIVRECAGCAVPRRNGPGKTNVECLDVTLTSALMFRRDPDECTYIAAKCDFVLVGSLSRGSAAALAGHRTELGKAIDNLVRCSAESGAKTF
jgi:hypothetical protein